MFGDIILELKKFFKQLLCIHKYEYREIGIENRSTWKCIKCGRRIIF